MTEAITALRISLGGHANTAEPPKLSGREVVTAYVVARANLRIQPSTLNAIVE